VLLHAVRETGCLGSDHLALNPDEFALLEGWVLAGAVWPVSETRTEDVDSHWSFQPIRMPKIPAAPVDQPDLAPIDRFIRAELSRKNLRFSPLADRRTLLRRVTYDLTGLPPAAEEIQAYLSDESPDAFAKVVDRLLASPHYGECWGRHWLDVARYAETNGQDTDSCKPHAYRYRDFVIDAFNQDMPFDHFVTCQLAGDLLPKKEGDWGNTMPEVATMFHWLGELQPQPVDPQLALANEIESQIDAIGKSFLGMTIACARCHDHKFDPISTEDYYALFGMMQSTANEEICLESAQDAQSRAKSIEELTSLDREISWLTRELQRKRRIVAAQQMPPYLLAAAEWLWEKTPDEALKHPEELTTFAKSKRLDGDKLSRWVAELKGDVGSAAEPFFVFVQAVKGPDREFAGRSQAVFQHVTQWKAPATSSVEQFAFDGFDDESFEPERWTAIGPAFASGPEPDLTALDQNRCANSFGGTHRLRGRLTSKPFRLEHRFINFRIAGGGFKDKTCLQLKFHSPVLPETFDYAKTGGNRHDLHWEFIDLQPFIGRVGIIEIVDDHEGDMGYVAVDDIFFSDELVTHPESQPNLVYAHLLKRPGVQSAAGLANAYRDLMVTVLEEWSQKQAASDSAAEEESLSEETALPADADPRKEQILRWALSPTGLLAPASLTETELAQLDLEPSLRARLIDLLRRRNEIESQIEAGQFAIVTRDRQPRDAQVQLRGSPATLGARVARGAPAMFGMPEQAASSGSSGRLELAAWITSDQNPLTARVIANRLWHYLFGIGLVDTPNNFGAMGSYPSHPELLDYLSQRVMDSGWSLKTVLRELVTSQTYQQSSAPHKELEQVDPQNRLLARMSVRRLDAEWIRDSILLFSGRLDRRQHGPSVPMYVPAYVSPGSDVPLVPGPLDGDGRRSIYLEVRRNHEIPFLSTFGLPKPDLSLGTRDHGPTAAQPLTLLNNPLVIAESLRWSERLLAETSEPSERIQRMFEEALSRPATPEEAVEMLKFVQQQSSLLRPDQSDENVITRQAWADACQVLLNSTYFLYLD
jgi:hypothetical protein